MSIVSVKLATEPRFSVVLDDRNHACTHRTNINKKNFGPGAFGSGDRMRDVPRSSGRRPRSPSGIGSECVTPPRFWPLSQCGFGSRNRMRDPTPLCAVLPVRLRICPGIDCVNPLPLSVVPEDYFFRKTKYALPTNTHGRTKKKNKKENRVCRIRRVHADPCGSRFPTVFTHRMPKRG